ncbi:tetratricopeptide repeat protein [candidate division KSB1 bacterium]|nr:tetratricopeptide repeat protein [candidate division KSB1 bacterium]
MDIAKIFESYPKLSVKNERVTQNPNTISWKNYILGKMVLHKRSFSEAKDYFELAIQSDSSNIYARTSLAAMYLELGFKAEKEGKSPAPSFSLADKYLKSVQKLDSSDTQNYQCYAKYYILTQKWNQAEAQLRNIIDKNPYNPYAYFYLTQLHSSRYQDLGFRNEEELLQHALNLFPGFVEAAISLSDYYYNYLQDHEKALGVLERMLQINPNQVDLLMNIGKLYISANKVLPALDIFRKIIELQPANSNAYYNLGILYYNTEEYEAALKLFERAIKIDNHLDSHLYIAYIFEKFYQATEDSSKRTDYYNQAIKYLRLRIRYRKGQDDQYAETARKHLAYLLQ